MATPETKVKNKIREELKKRNIFNFNLMAGLGSFPGVPDRIMHYHGRVIYLEVKSPKGVMSPYQLEFRKQCAEDGVEYYVIRELNDLIKIL